MTVAQLGVSIISSVLLYVYCIPHAKCSLNVILRRTDELNIPTALGRQFIILVQEWKRKRVLKLPQNIMYLILTKNWAFSFVKKVSPIRIFFKKISLAKLKTPIYRLLFPSCYPGTKYKKMYYRQWISATTEWKSRRKPWELSMEWQFWLPGSRRPSICMVSFALFWLFWKKFNNSLAYPIYDCLFVFKTHSALEVSYSKIAMLFVPFDIRPLVVILKHFEARCFGAVVGSKISNLAWTFQFQFLVLSRRCLYSQK